MAFFVRWEMNMQLADASIPAQHGSRAFLRSSLLMLFMSICIGHSSAASITGVVWQPENATIAPQGKWDQIGAHQLLIQWTAVDNLAFVAGAGIPAAPQLPDWKRIAGEPWAREVILGLAGYFDENKARANLDELGALSARLAKLPTPLNVVGWYFPVEIDPTWNNAAKLAPLLASLPRPLWISVYDSANVGPDDVAKWLASWLPKDVGVFFQDGVGVHAREAYVAVDYLNALEKRLGKQRVRVIAEAFRPQIGGGFRSATIDELMPQLNAYGTRKVYLFDGPHYVSDTLVDQIKSRLKQEKTKR